MADAVVLKGLSKTFGETVAVENLDLVVPQGALYGVIGPNGAGKTTTIRMILSILFPDRGELTVLGRRSAMEAKDREMNVKGGDGVRIESLAHFTAPDSTPKAEEWCAQ